MASLTSKQLTAHMAKERVIQDIMERSLEKLRDDLFIVEIIKETGWTKGTAKAVLGGVILIAVEETIAEIKRELPWK